MIPCLPAMAALADHPNLAGVFVGGCVARGVGSSFRAQGHAHTGHRDPHCGWVCIRSSRRLVTASGNLGQLVLHELAHIDTGQGHTDKWRARCQELGYRLQANERKRT